MVLNINTPDKSFYHGEILKFFTENSEGKFEILPHHAYIVTYLRPNISSFIDAKGNEKKFFNSEGILIVKANIITLNADAAEWPEDIDIERAKKAKERAEKRLNSKDGMDVKRAQAALMRAMVRINTTINE